MAKKKAQKVSCPECQKAFVPKDRTELGQVRCPNSECNALFTLPSDFNKKKTAEQTSTKTGPRRPELFDVLPLSPVLSPGFKVLGFVMVMVYGVVLSGVLSAMPKKEKPLPPPPLPPPRTSVTNTQPSPPPKPTFDPNAPFDPTQIAANTSSGPSNETKKKTALVPVLPTTGLPLAFIKLTDLKEPIKPQEPKVDRSFDDLLPLTDPAGDCQLEKTAKGVKLSVPGRLHNLDPGVGSKNSPMCLADLDDDFILEVVADGDFKPGMYASQGLPVAYQGGGLVLWVDQDNYLKFERSASVVQGRGAVGHKIAFEYVQENAHVADGSAEGSAKPMNLKLERHGPILTISYSSDGRKTWKEMKTLRNAFPAHLQAGIIASNTAKKPMEALFDDLSLKELYTPAQNQERMADYKDRLARWEREQKVYEGLSIELRSFEARTIDLVQPNDEENEKAHKLAGGNMDKGENNGHRWRHANKDGWFEYELAVEPGQPQELRVTYWGTDSENREFDILIDDEKLASDKLDGSMPDKFFDRIYAIPKQAIEDKDHIKVKFKGHPGNMAGGIYSLRVMRPLKAGIGIRESYVQETLVPHSENGKPGATWRYNTNRPSDNWIDPDFDDRGWQTGVAGFGSGNIGNNKPQTPWGPSENVDIYLRTEFDVPDNNTVGLKWTYCHDDDLDVFLNGVPVMRHEKYSPNYETSSGSDMALKALRRGRNVLAVKCHQGTGGQYVDVGLVRRMPESDKKVGSQDTAKSDADKKQPDASKAAASEKKP